MKKPTARYFFKVILPDYLNFLAFLLFLLVNSTLGKALYLVDRRWKTRWLDRLIVLYEKLA